MLRALIQKANDSNPAVAANIMMCLGELACVAGESATPHVQELMQIVLAKLSDPTAVKRDAALHTLGQVCSSTGYVIQPLIDYPQLLPLLGKIMKTENSPSTRREVVKVLGILGALDPFRRKVDWATFISVDGFLRLSLHHRVDQRMKLPLIRRRRWLRLIKYLLASTTRPRARMITSRRWSLTVCLVF